MKRGLIGKVGLAIGYVVMMFVATWLLASWADVICHNTSDYVYQWWNIFTIVF